MEVELKYLVPAGEGDEIFEDPLVRAKADPRSEERLAMSAIYYDTKDRTLGKNKIALRIRREGTKIVSTIKWDEGLDEGLKDGKFTRGEINIPLKDNPKAFEPNIEIFKDSPAYDRLVEVVGFSKLVPVLKMEFIRKEVRLDLGSAICELSLDKGKIIAGTDGTLEEPISELEIELYSGKEDAMVDLGKKIASKYGLEVGTKSKYQKGLELMGEL